MRLDMSDAVPMSATVCPRKLKASYTRDREDEITLRVSLSSNEVNGEVVRIRQSVRAYGHKLYIFLILCKRKVHVTVQFLPVQNKRRLCYENQSVNAVWGTSRCLIWVSYEIQNCTVLTEYEVLSVAPGACS
jgi:hypothetical protein